MKGRMINRRFLTILLSCLLLSLMSAPALTAFASEFPEASEESGKAETVIRVTGDEGTKVTVKTDEGSPEPDRSEFTCTGDREKDCFTIRITEPGEYSYSFTVGNKEYRIRISGIYEETEEGEVLCAKTAISNPDGTKTDEPTDTPFGIPDIEKGPALVVMAIVVLAAATGVILILRKREDKAR